MEEDGGHCSAPVSTSTLSSFSTTADHFIFVSGERPPGDLRIEKLRPFEKYCLVPSPPGHARHGFGRMLKQCFAVNEGRPEGLMKALEREVYKLAKMEKRAFPELFER